MAPRTKSGGGGRGTGQRNRSVRTGTTTSTSSDKTKQSLDDLTDIVFDIGDNRTADGFVNAKKRLVEVIGSTFEQGANIAVSIKTGVLYVVPMPVEPVTALISAATQAVPATSTTTRIPAVPAVYAPLTNMQQMILAGQVRSYLLQEQKLTENIKKAFAIVYKQCTENLKSKLEQHKDWAALSLSCDVLALLELIRSMVFKYEDRMFQPLSLHKVKQSFYSFRQGNLPNVEYLQSFKNRYEMANSHGVILYDREVAIMLMKQNPADATKDFYDPSTGNLTQAERDEYLRKAKDLCQATAFLSQSDSKRYSELLVDLQNDYTKGKDTYPIL
jgi:hypothetical protein